MKKNVKLRPWAVFFWIVLWQILGMAFNESLLFPTPVIVISAFVKMCGDASFYQAVIFSGGRILLGVCLGTLLATFFAVLSYKFSAIEHLLYPFVTVVKSVPVASFIILALIWLNPKSLTVFIVLLMIFPVIYQNTLTGLNSVDRELLEVAEVFDVSPGKRALYIYLPGVLPYFRTALSVGIGLSFKAGTAAEVIGIPRGSLGEILYKSKVYFLTPELFAVTLTIIIMSLFFEKILLALCDLVIRKAEIDD